MKIQRAALRMLNVLQIQQLWKGLGNHNSFEAQIHPSYTDTS